MCDDALMAGSTQSARSFAFAQHDSHRFMHTKPPPQILALHSLPVKPSIRQIVLFAAGFGLLMALVKLLEMSFFSGMITAKIYITVIGVTFLAIGLMLGRGIRHEEAQEADVDANEVGMTGGDGGLSEREREVLSHVAAGLSNREIGDRLFVSEHTVKKHLVNVYTKLGVSRRTQAVSRAREMGLIE